MFPVLGTSVVGLDCNLNIMLSVHLVSLSRLLNYKPQVNEWREPETEQSIVIYIIILHLSTFSSVFTQNLQV